MLKRAICATGIRSLEQFHADMRYDRSQTSNEIAATAYAFVLHSRAETRRQGGGGTGPTGTTCAARNTARESPLTRSTAAKHHSAPQLHIGSASTPRSGLSRPGLRALFSVNHGICIAVRWHSAVPLFIGHYHRHVFQGESNSAQQCSSSVRSMELPSSVRN